MAAPCSRLHLAPPGSGALDGALALVCTAAESIRTTAPLSRAPSVGEPGIKQRPGAVGRFTSLIAWVDGCGVFSTCDPRSGRRFAQRFTVRHAPDELELDVGGVARLEAVTFELDDAALERRLTVPGVRGVEVDPRERTLRPGELTPVRHVPGPRWLF